MQSLNYSLQENSKPAVGLIVLQTDEVLEPEIRGFMDDKNVPIYHSRVPSGADVTPDTLAAMEMVIPDAVSLLPPAADIKVIAYCCTSGSVVIGEENVVAAIHSVRPGVAVTNPITAVKARLQSLNAKRIALLTPYEPQVSNAMSEHLQASGFEITRFGAFGEKQEAKVVRIDRASVCAAIESIGSTKECDCVFASCTNLRTLDLIDEMAEKIGKPVISSNSALGWHIDQLLLK